MFQKALAAVPMTDRNGPLGNGRNRPADTPSYYQDLYRDAAGVRRAVWNMFARHGGITEAHDSGADLVDVSKNAQHTDLDTTNRHYTVSPSRLLEVLRMRASLIGSGTKGEKRIWNRIRKTENYSSRPSRGGSDVGARCRRELPGAGSIE
jgi:hypothetical protein